MAIIIPSRSIYDKKVAKVKKNIVNAISVKTISPEIKTNDNTTVYTKTVATNHIAISYKDKYDYLAAASGQQLTALGYVQLNTYTYSNSSFKIPKFNSKLGATIKNILTGKDDDGSTYIKATAKVARKYGTVTGTATYKGNYEWEITDIEKDYDNENITTENIDLDTLSVEIKSGDYANSVSIQVDTNNFDETTIYDFNDGNFTIDIKTICGYEKVATMTTFFHSVNTGDTHSLTGTCERAQPISLTLSFQGSNIEFDFQEGEIKIGEENSKNSVIIEANELLQENNTLLISESQGEETAYNAIETTYADTLTEYKEGKETATLRCSVGNYYDENGELAVSIDSQNLIPFPYNSQSKTFRGVFFGISNGSILAQGTAQSGCSLSLFDGTDTENVIVFPRPTTIFASGVPFVWNETDGYEVCSMSVFCKTVNENGEINYSDFIVNSAGGKIDNVTEIRQIAISIKEGNYVNNRFYPMINYGNTAKTFSLNNLPMTFNIYDEVIPMRRGADGKEYPFSYYPSGNLKRFSVLSVKPNFNGGVWQDLQLQEVREVTEQ